MLYRGDNFPESVVENDYGKIGGIFSYRAFMSTSRSKETAEYFCGFLKPPENYEVLYEIDCTDKSLIDINQIIDPAKYAPFE